MSFTTEGSQAFLSANDDDDEAANLAALDSMTSGMSNQSAFMSQQMSGGGTNTAMTPTTTTTTTAAANNNGGEMGESLFDRIRRRTEEQQRQQQAQAQAAAQAQSSSTNTASSQQPTSTTTESNNTHNIAGLEHEPSDGSIPPTSASTAFDAAVQSAANPTPTTTTTEQTYAFTATIGEDFSFQPQQPPSIPTYGPSRNDPSYYSANNNANTPSSLQDRAAMAFNDAGDTMKSLFTKGLNGANSLVASAQSKFGAGGGGGMGSGYTNNFLLREDSMEQGGAPTPPTTTAEPMQMNASSGPSELNQMSGQAYSMISYAKIFCEDLYGFLMQLPPLGKVGVLVVLIALWLLMRG